MHAYLGLEIERIQKAHQRRALRIRRGARCRRHHQRVVRDGHDGVPVPLDGGGEDRADQRLAAVVGDVDGDHAVADAAGRDELAPQVSPRPCRRGGETEECTEKKEARKEAPRRRNHALRPPPPPISSGHSCAGGRRVEGSELMCELLVAGSTVRCRRREAAAALLVYIAAATVLPEVSLPKLYKLNYRAALMLGWRKLFFYDIYRRSLIYKKDKQKILKEHMHLS